MHCKGANMSIPASQVKRGAALAAAVLLVGGLAACSPTTDPGSGAKATDLTYQFAGVPLSLDPALGGSGGSAIFTALAYDPLIYLTGDGDLVADPATPWEFNSDNTQLPLPLRDGVTFRDGNPLDAAAVTAS